MSRSRTVLLITILLAAIVLALIFFEFPGLLKAPSSFIFNDSSSSPTTKWKIRNGNSTFMRGAHMGVYGDFNQYMVETLPDEYFKYLRDLNANWVGISVALFVKNSLDSTVERKTSGTDLRTYKDEELRRLIRRLRRHGFHVYVTLAFEGRSETKEHLYHRAELGAANEQRSDWPWNKNHPRHTQFVKEFWQTYTKQAVHFAKIAQNEGVEMYSLGTETEGLFITRETSGRKGAYIKELKKMLSDVRSVYKEKVTYDMHATAIDERIESAALNRKLWQDLDFDVIGISSYFSPLSTLPKGVTSITQLEKGWQAIFAKHLIPLQKNNPNMPIVFTEHQNYTSRYAGYDGPLIDDIEEANNLRERKTVDTNHNNVDDGQEQQANVHKAFFNVAEKNPGVVDGVFLWGEDYWETDGFGDDLYWDEEGSRGKKAEEVIRNIYKKLRAK